MNVHKTFRRRPGRLWNVLCTFNLRPVSTGFLPFLLRCRPFLPRCTFLMFTLSINSTFNCPKCLLSLDKVRAALPLSFLMVSLETITLQVGNIFVMYCFSWSNSSRICLDVFETASFVPICSIRCYGFFLSNGTRWCFRSSIVAPLRSQTLTTWFFFESRFSSIAVSIESSTIKQVPVSHPCLKVPGVSFENLEKIDQNYLNLNENDQVSVLLYGYQINKSKNFNQSILKNVISYVKVTAQFDKLLDSFKQWILLSIKSQWRN